MPKIQWAGLPPALRDHLFDRLRERRITADDLYKLKLWRESEPDAPDGLWYKELRLRPLPHSPGSLTLRFHTYSSRRGAGAPSAVGRSKSPAALLNRKLENIE